MGHQGSCRGQWDKDKNRCCSLHYLGHLLNGHSVYDPHQSSRSVCESTVKEILNMDRWVFTFYKLYNTQQLQESFNSKGRI